MQKPIKLLDSNIYLIDYSTRNTIRGNKQICIAGEGPAAVIEIFENQVIPSKEDSYHQIQSVSLLAKEILVPAGEIDESQVRTLDQAEKDAVTTAIFAYQGDIDKISTGLDIGKMELVSIIREHGLEDMLNAVAKNLGGIDLSKQEPLEPTEKKVEDKSSSANEQPSKPKTEDKPKAENKPNKKSKYNKDALKAKAAKVKELREKANLTQKELGDLVGLDQSRVSMVERISSFAAVKRYADMFINHLESNLKSRLLEQD